MRKAKLFLNCASKKNKAFTLIETLVSLLIITLISTVMYFAFSSSIKNIIKIKEKQRTDYKLFQIEKTIRNIISSVDIPFWKNDFYFLMTEDSISCNYMNGNKKVETKKFSYPVESVNFEVVYFENTKPVGIKIEYDFKDQHRIVNQTFASLPIGLYKNE